MLRASSRSCAKPNGTASSPSRRTTATMRTTLRNMFPRRLSLCVPNNRLSKLRERLSTLAVLAVLWSFAEARAANLMTREVSLGKVLPTAISETLLVSPDQKRVAYAAIRAAKWLVVVDGKESKSYDKVIGLTFSPDGQHLAHVARRGENFLVVRDGAESNGYDDIGEGSVTFSPDSQHLA